MRHNAETTPCPQASFHRTKLFIDKLNHLQVRPPLPTFPIHPYDPTNPFVTAAVPSFAPTQLKAVQTTTPKDPKGKKVKRMEEVKAKRRERVEEQRQRVEQMKKKGVLVNGKLRGGTEAKVKAAAERQAKATEKNRLRQKKLNAKRAAHEAGAKEAVEVRSTAGLIPVQPSPAAAS
jgi:hypothetical protein